MSRQWVITASFAEYDIFGAAETLDGIWWTVSKSTKNINVNDIVYLYVGVPYSKVMYKFICTDVKKQVHSSFDESDLKYWRHKEDYVPGIYDYFRIKKLQYVDDDNLSLGKLNELGLVKTHIQGSYKSDNHPELFEYLNKQFSKYSIIEDDVIYSMKVNIVGPVDEIDDIPIKSSLNKKAILNNVYKRNPDIARYAIQKADYTCEADKSHTTFISRGTGMPYLEAHHLIPVSAQAKFENSLDVPANIIALCSSCHNEIHYGKEADKLITKLYNLRKERLLKAGIKIRLKELLDLYKM